jgi:hypothetical protein
VTNGEPVGLQLRQVENVADEALEPVGLGGDDVERHPHLLGLGDDPSRSASTCPRIAVSGVRSSCDTDMRNERLSCSASASCATIPEALGEERDLVRRRAPRGSRRRTAGGDVLGRRGQARARAR